MIFLLRKIFSSDSDRFGRKKVLFNLTVDSLDPVSYYILFLFHFTEYFIDIIFDRETKFSKCLFL